jgi:hypothetical protein
MIEGRQRNTAVKVLLYFRPAGRRKNGAQLLRRAVIVLFRWYRQRLRANATAPRSTTVACIWLEIEPSSFTIAFLSADRPRRPT